MVPVITICHQNTFFPVLPHVSPKSWIFEEPISEWQDVCAFNLLALMSKTAKKWAFPFQVTVFSSMLGLLNIPTTKQRLLERSPHWAMKLFVSNLKWAGFLTDEEFAVLNYFYESILHQVNKPHHFFCIRVSPEIDYQRSQMNPNVTSSTCPFPTVNENFLGHAWVIMCHLFALCAYLIFLTIMATVCSNKYK